MRVSACEDSSRHKELSFVRHSQNSFCEAFPVSSESGKDVESNEHDLEVDWFSLLGREASEKIKLKSLIMAQIERWRQA